MPQPRTCPPLVSRLAAALVAAAALTAGAALGQVGQAGKPDPVEAFRHALQLERNIRNDDKAALAYRKQNLTEKAKQVQSLSDLSRVLLLSEWQTEATAGSRPGTGFDWEVRLAESQVRQDLTKRFEDGVKKVLQSRNPDQLAAVANLLNETVVGSSTLGASNSLGGRERLFLYGQLANLAPNLVPLTRNPSAEVRAAAARALGNFPTKPEVAVDALRALLAPEWDVRTRLAAADALGNLVRVVGGRQSGQRSSEPGVALKPDQARSFAFQPKDEVKVYEVVVPATARGLADADPDVRRACVNAIRQVTLSLTEMVPNVELAPEYITLPGLPYPAPGRTSWTPRERERVNEGRAFVRDLHRNLDRVLPEFQKNIGALTRASADPDPTVRIRARQALEDLALVRRLLNNLDAFMPADPAGTLPPPGPEKARPDTGTRPGVSLGAPAPAGPGPLPRDALGAVALPPKPVAASPAPGLVLVRLEQAGQEKKAPETANDPLGQAVDQARRALIEGMRDPDPRGRLAAIDALELFGTRAEPAIPALAAALGDRNKFVRWAAARTLGHMALGEREALPGLVRLICDPDLDVRIGALEALRRYGPKVAAAVPALTAALGRGDTEARLATLRALAAIGPAAEPSLPAVARALKNPDPRLRGEAARTLGTFGSAAAPFVAALREAMEDPDSDVRKAASEAILRITLGQ
jgi:HEAT repeat protein